MKILIVDDNAHHSELALRRLSQEGWDVTATDSPEPSEDFKNYDFLLLDYNMPTRSGLDVLKRMKELDIRTPVIFLTGQGNEVIASEAIKQGAYDYVVKDTQLHFLDRLPSVIREAKSKHELIETNRFLIQELRRANERLQKMTFTDEMTGIFNYRFVKKQLEIEVQRAHRYEKPLSLCIIDIDRFKEINDRHGHPVGDAVLKEIAKILTQSTRSVDFVGRYAGDEFVIIFPDTQLQDAVRLCERIRKTISEQSLDAHGKSVQVTLSMGLADFDLKKRSTADALLEAADLRLYQAKRAGRNRVYSTMKVIDSSRKAEAETVSSALQK
jgi:diguanylate cyclase (GGDEF)-like protein